MPRRRNWDTRGSGKFPARRERNQRPKLSPTCIKRFCDLPAAQSKWTTLPPSSSSAFKPACYSRKEKRKYRLILMDVSPVAQGFSTFEDRKPFAKSLRALFQRIPRHTFRLLRNLFQAGFQRDLIFQNPRVQKFHHPLQRLLVNLPKSLLERNLSHAQIADQFRVAGFQAAGFDAVLQFAQRQFSHARVRGSRFRLCSVHGVALLPTIFRPAETTGSFRCHNRLVVSVNTPIRTNPDGFQTGYLLAFLALFAFRAFPFFMGFSRSQRATKRLMRRSSVSCDFTAVRYRTICRRSAVVIPRNLRCPFGAFRNASARAGGNSGSRDSSSS